MADWHPPKENEKNSQPDGWRSFQRHRGKLLGATILISALIHFFSVEHLGGRNPQLLHLPQSKSAPIKFKVVQVPKKKDKEKEPPAPSDIPKILEMPQTKTERPDEASYAGTVDHKAVKEMRLPDEVKRERAKDPGQKGKPDVKPDTKIAADRPDQPKPQKSPQTNNSEIKSKSGHLAMGTFNPKPRNDYEALLPTSISDLPGQLNAGFQDYIDDKVQNGDRIDMNTTEYRYIGYFTNMRKAIELVWNYPLDAARKGLQGEVGLEFAILKDGHATHIRVIKSSGYESLDKAIVEAIKLASPFSPLPEGFNKQKIVITGAFRYILSAYGSH